MELEDLNLENLSVKQLRELITLVARQTTLKNYTHSCGNQVRCSSCGKWFCYACYNLHIKTEHGDKLAQFNEKLNSGSFFLPEKREVKPKIKVEVKVKVKREKKIKTPWGSFTKAEINKILESLGE